MKYEEEAVKRLLEVCKRILCYLPRAYDAPGPHGQLVKAISDLENQNLQRLQDI
jgi:hypothetical protein